MAEISAADSPEEGEARGRLCIKIARTSWRLGDKEAAAAFLDRAQAESPESEVSDEVHELRSKWKF